MKTISQLITHLREVFGSKLEVHYIHPMLYLLVTDEQFDGDDSETRLAKIRSAVGVTDTALTQILARGIVQLVPVTAKERAEEYTFLTASDSGQHWLNWYSRPKTVAVSAPTDTDAPRAVHFYGYKGGQARSTVLVLLAKTLADSGARVLIVDADVEAPSLDTFFEVSSEDPAATLMGLCGWAENLQPIPRVYVGRPNAGTIDLLACRPRAEIYDIDFAGFLVNTSVDTRILKGAAKRLRLEAKTKYDFVFFDHRTGLAPSILPILDGWPGPTIIFVRPDGMSRQLERSTELRALLSYDPETPGAFVSFSLDPKETVEIAKETHGRFIERLLESLSDALLNPADSTNADPDPSLLERYWILWHHDLALLGRTPPSPVELSSVNRSALAQIQEVLGLSVEHPPKHSLDSVGLSKSGSTDQGIFILTPDVERLFSTESKFLYIFGRKGTGKTRLLRELCDRGLGEPLLVAQDFNGAGVRSGDANFKQLFRATNSDFEAFWWALLHITLLEGNNTEKVTERVNAITIASRADFLHFASPRAIESLLQTSAVGSSPRVLLIDGVETAVPAANLREFVESLFRFLATAQYSRTIANALTIRLFLRSDLYKSAAQNVEQQIEGYVMHLRWDRTSILNFAVARLASLDWFRVAFPLVVDRIDGQLQRISKGGLTDAEAEELLLEVFPRGLERNKIKTTTFLSTYFSDAGGDNEARASFYPRLFDGFLREINDSAKRVTEPPIKGDRLNSPFVLRAYDVASAAFIEEVKTELYNLIDLAGEDSQNRDAVDRFIDAFSGLSTPFVVEDIISELVERTSFQTEKARGAINRMKQLGIFEDRPGYPGSWRAGRLYKAGLKMKYVRS
jgi:Mrp family chromosome partitioning ATPase